MTLGEQDLYDVDITVLIFSSATGQTKSIITVMSTETFYIVDLAALVKWMGEIMLNLKNRIFGQK
jgi:hypothetical protein